MSDNFFDLFDVWVGESPTPPLYLRWAAISMIAACLSNRVWVVKSVGAQRDPVYPNLYTILFGPTGNGKSWALSRAMKLLYSSNYSQHINVFEGGLTGESFIDELKPTRRNPNANHLYLVQDEMSKYMARKENVKAFIATLTDLYIPRIRVLKHRTREMSCSSLTTREGEPIVSCVNYIGTTVDDWFVESLDRSTLYGGFLPRINLIYSSYTGKIITDTSQPEDWQRLNDYLIERINGFFLLNGEFKRTPEAARYEQNWYRSRPTPESLGERAYFQREFDTLLKLEIIYAVADGSDYLIEEKHVEQATESMEPNPEQIERLMMRFNMTPADLKKRDLLETIKISSPVSRTLLTRYAYKMGFDAAQLDKMLETWHQAGFIQTIHAPRVKGGGIKYVWRGPR